MDVSRVRYLLITVPRSVFPRTASAGRLGVFGGLFFNSASATSIAFSAEDPGRR